MYACGPVLAACLAALLLAACGGSGSKNGRATINLWVFQEPSGSFTDAAKRCSDQSGGRDKIVFNALSNDADQQRQSLVRRLAAKDSSIDIAGMDVVWTAEFAEAGWIKPWPAAEAAKISQGTLAGPLTTATYKGRLWAALANTNTQLLWYRKDLVSDPAATWDGLISSRRWPPTRSRASSSGKRLILTASLAIAMFPPVAIVGPLYNLWRNISLYAAPGVFTTAIRLHLRVETTSCSPSR
jgi:maltose-binding protein MalE